MKIADIVAQLSLILPKYTDLFSETLSVFSITASSNVATIVTAVAHGLSSGVATTLSDVTTLTPITAVSKDGNIYTFTTGSDHDLTFGDVNHLNALLSGFTDSAWNGSFTITAVPNRRNFKVRSTNTLPVLNGNEVLEEVRADGVNGRFAVTVVDPTTFTIAGSFLDGDYLGGKVSTAVRIAGAVTVERAKEEYTEQNANELWMFVTGNDAEISKDRSSFSDADATKPTGNDMRLRLLDGFTISLIQDTSGEVTAVDANDNMRDTLLLPILKSVNGARFPTGLSGSADFRVILQSHGIESYNRATLVYTYGFQFVMDLTDSDTVEPEDDMAFRDINYTLEQGGDDTIDMDVIPVDLDDEPL
jgi:hypothetical protein